MINKNTPGKGRKPTTSPGKPERNAAPKKKNAATNSPAKSDGQKRNPVLQMVYKRKIRHLEKLINKHAPDLGTVYVRVRILPEEKSFRMTGRGQEKTASKRTGIIVKMAGMIPVPMQELRQGSVLLELPAKTAAGMQVAGLPKAKEILNGMPFLKGSRVRQKPPGPEGQEKKRISTIRKPVNHPHQGKIKRGEQSLPEVSAKLLNLLNQVQVKLRPGQPAQYLHQKKENSFKSQGSFYEHMLDHYSGISLIERVYGQYINLLQSGL